VPNSHSDVGFGFFSCSVARSSGFCQSTPTRFKHPLTRAANAAAVVGCHCLPSARAPASRRSTHKLTRCAYCRALPMVRRFAGDTRTLSRTPLRGRYALHAAHTLHIPLPHLTSPLHRTCLHTPRTHLPRHARLTLPLFCCRWAGALPPSYSRLSLYRLVPFGRIPLLTCWLGLVSPPTPHPHLSITYTGFFWAATTVDPHQPPHAWWREGSAAGHRRSDNVSCLLLLPLSWPHLLFYLPLVHLLPVTVPTSSAPVRVFLVAPCA